MRGDKIKSHTTFVWFTLASSPDDPLKHVVNKEGGVEEDEEEHHVRPRVLPELHRVAPLLQQQDEPNETCATKTRGQKGAGRGRQGRKWADVGGNEPRKELGTAGFAQAGEIRNCYADLQLAQ